MMCLLPFWGLKVICLDCQLRDRKLSDFIKKIIICFPISKEVLRVWNDMRASKY